MKKQVTFTQKIWYVTILVLAVFAFNPMYGQSGNSTSQKGRIIKGTVSSPQGPLEGANVILKGENQGAVTNKKGEFTFPVALETGDVLVITYLGYESIEYKIKADTTFVKAVLSDEVIEFMGAVNTNKRYKSKRKN
ncbi:carboxypepD_reg-like domain protein [Kordia sp. SMS9]|uniref:carboxypeptidase-like regulatory domain-containing protein n=1 Tax=Kordia sp. SMS9 TaxID=2282170 RepID=UPI000E1087F9|nr:carboxypeptidase-like regulatory domain-containing protein [Kordia sp. SMS9]AXG69640.1 carboxypepD_reg-like domain protein [Kordia sp. SMS9]